MKILHVIESGGFYGAERVLTELLLGLTTLGHDVTLMSFSCKKRAEKPLEKICNELSINMIPISMGKVKALSIGVWLQGYAEKNGFDIVHSHGYKFNVLLALTPACLRKVPVCTTLHGYVVTPTLSKMTLYQWLDRCCLNRLDAVFLVSERMKQISAIKKLPEATISVIENGIGGYQAATRAEAVDPVEARLLAFLQGRGPRLMAAGRLAAEKGFDTLIETMATLVNAEPDTVLVIFGNGPEENRLRNKIRDLRLAGNILLFGFTDSLTSYYRYFDLFVMPSLTEGTPMALLEAMNAKLACVATKVGGIPYMLDHGSAGWLIDPEDTEQLLRAIKESITARDQQNKIERAHERILEHFHYLKMAEKYLTHYEKLRAIS